jgi:hypothetical protein
MQGTGIGDNHPNPIADQQKIRQLAYSQSLKRSAEAFYGAFTNPGDQLLQPGLQRGKMIGTVTPLIAMMKMVSP